MTKVWFDFELTDYQLGAAPVPAFVSKYGTSDTVCDWLSVCLSVCVYVYICSYYKLESVLIALAITAAVCVSISIFAIQTKVSNTDWFTM